MWIASQIINRETEGEMTIATRMMCQGLYAQSEKEEKRKGRVPKEVRSLEEIQGFACTAWRGRRLCRFVDVNAGSTQIISSATLLFPAFCPSKIRHLPLLNLSASNRSFSTHP